MAGMSPFSCTLCIWLVVGAGRVRGFLLTTPGTLHQPMDSHICWRAATDKRVPHQARLKLAVSSPTVEPPKVKRPPLQFKKANPGIDVAEITRQGTSTVFRGIGWGLRAIGPAFVATKDALWDAVDFAGGTLEQLQQPSSADEAVGSVPSQSTAEGSAPSPFEAVKQIVAAPEIIIDNTKGALYGAADAARGLPGAITAPLEAWKQDQAERERKAREARRARDATLRAVAGAAEGAKEAVYATADTVTSVVTAVVQAPAAVEGAVQGAVRTVEGVVETVEGVVETTGVVLESVTTTASRVQRVPGEVIGTVTKYTEAVQAWDRERRERPAREAAAAAAAKEAAAEKRRKEVLFTFKGKEYTGWDIAKTVPKVAGSAAVTAARGGWAFAQGGVRVGKAVIIGAKVTVRVVQIVVATPEKVLRSTLGPLHEYQESQRRIRAALKADISLREWRQEQAATAASQPIAPPKPPSRLRKPPTPAADTPSPAADQPDALQRTAVGTSARYLDHLRVNPIVSPDQTSSTTSHPNSVSETSDAGPRARSGTTKYLDDLRVTPPPQSADATSPEHAPSK